MEQNNSKFVKRLTQYGSFALAAIGVSEADGQVVYTDVNPDFSGSMGSSHAIDFNNDGVDDVIIDNSTVYSFSAKVFADPQGTNAVLGSIGGGIYAYPYALNSGDNISSGAGGTFLNSYYANSMNYGGFFGNWIGVADKYLGVRFDISGSTHYGWVRLDVAVNGDFIVKDFAYESSPGVGITAGEMPTTACIDPSSLAANNETDNSAELTWTAGGSETEWEIEYGTTGFTPGAGTIVADNDGTLGETLTGLTASTTYDFYVAAICGVGNESGQVGPQSFTTLAPPCLDVTNISVSGITDNSADIAWTAGGTETEWEIEYGTTGFTPGSGTIVADNDGTLGETLTGLTASTTYDFYVTAICGVGNESGQVGPQSFNTLAPPCLDVTNISVSGITDNTADIAWTAGGTETEWEIEYGTTGFTSGSGTIVADNDGTLGETLTGLTASTTYEVYVTAICGAGNESGQVGPETFTTEPMGITSQNFEGFSFHPNPVQEELTLIANSNIQQITLYDLLGKEVISVKPNERDVHMEMSGLKIGIYLMKVSIDGKTKTFKLIKK